MKFAESRRTMHVRFLFRVIPLFFACFACDGSDSSADCSTVGACYSRVVSTGLVTASVSDLDGATLKTCWDTECSDVHLTLEDGQLHCSPMSCKVSPDEGRLRVEIGDARSFRGGSAAYSLRLTTTAGAVLADTSSTVTFESDGASCGGCPQARLDW